MHPKAPSQLLKLSDTRWPRAGPRPEGVQLVKASQWAPLAVAWGASLRPGVTLSPGGPTAIEVRLSDSPAPPGQVGQVTIRANRGPCEDHEGSRLHLNLGLWAQLEVPVGLVWPADYWHWPWHKRPTTAPQSCPPAAFLHRHDSDNTTRSLRLAATWPQARADPGSQACRRHARTDEAST